MTNRIAQHYGDNPTAMHNLSHLQKFVQQQATAAVTGGTCPKCGEGANPTIVANFGHCLKCQRSVR